MPKAEWGVKRTCPSCEARFYDLQHQPIVCPQCGATFAIDTHGKVSASRERRVPVAVAEEEDPLVEDEDVVEDAEDEDADEPLLADDDEEDDPAGPALAEEEAEEEGAVAFKDPELIDGDDIDDEADEAEDEDDIEELDELPEDDRRQGG
jgi:hypothetical protein